MESGLNEEKGNRCDYPCCRPYDQRSKSPLWIERWCIARVKGGRQTFEPRTVFLTEAEDRNSSRVVEPRFCDSQAACGAKKSEANIHEVTNFLNRRD
jgi:hypothetical protein